MRFVQRTALLVLPATGLSGCVAAAVPVLVGGMAARHVFHGARAQPDDPAPVDGHVASTVATPAPAAPAPVRAAKLAYPPVPEDMTELAGKPGNGPPIAPASVIEPLPTDPRDVRAGQVYRGASPLPGPVAITPTAMVAEADPVAREGRVAGPATRPHTPGWSALGRYVTAHLSGASSALLPRGGGAPATPPPPCASLPLAVLAPAALVEAAARNAADRGWLDAMHTLNITLVLTAPGPVNATALARAGLPAPVAGNTLFVPTAPTDMPAIRAKVAARYCVLAVAGSDAADFPNGYLPGTTPPAYRDRWGAGWFLFPPR